MNSSQRFFSILCTSFLLLGAAHGAKIEEVQSTTDEPEPTTAKAAVVVNPFYFDDRDGSGNGTPAISGGAGMIGRWDFEETGTGPFANRIEPGAANSSAPALTGQILGAGGSLPSTTAAGVSRALSLSGSNYAKATLAAPNNSGEEGRFSVSFWFKPNASTNNFQNLWYLENYFYNGATPAPMVLTYIKVAGGGNYFSVRSVVSGTGHATSALYGSVVTGSAAGPSSFYINYPITGFDDTKWHHVALTYYKGATGDTIGGAFRFYLDGVLKGNFGSVPSGASMLTSNASKIGWSNPHHMYAGSDGVFNTYNLNGPIDRLRVYRTTLAEADVLTLSGQDVDGDGISDLTEVNDTTTVSNPLDPDSPGPRTVAMDDQGLATTYATTGTWTDNASFITVASIEHLEVNMIVNGPGIKPLTKVTAINTTTKRVTLDKTVSPKADTPQILNFSIGTSTAAKGKFGKWDFEATNVNGEVKNLMTADSNGDLSLGGATVPDSVGMPSKSARFDGGGLMTSKNNLAWGTGNSYSSSFWVKFKAGGELARTPNRFVIWSVKGLGGSTANQIVLSVRKLGNGLEIFELTGIRGTTGGSIAWQPDRTLNFSEGGWHHITLTASGSTYVLYVDGIKYGGTDGAGTVTNTGDTLWKGMAFNGGMSLEVGGTATQAAAFKNFEGNLDRLRFWSVVLDQTDVTNMYLQDYDSDKIPDIAEITGGLDPLIPLNNGELPTAEDDPTWDQNNFTNSTAVNANLIGHWNFESFRYDGFGRYFENQANITGQKLRPNSAVWLSGSEAIASEYASFNGTGSASVAIGAALSGKPNFAVAGWLKLARGSVWDLPGTFTPLFDIKDTLNGSNTSDSYHLYAVRQGAYTQIYYRNFDITDPAWKMGTQMIRWEVPRNLRIDNEDWHHLVFQRETNSSTPSYELYVDTVKLKKLPITGDDVNATVNFNNTTAPPDGSMTGTILTIGGSRISGKEYGIKGGWDRLRLYSSSLSAAVRSELYDQDADNDDVKDREEIGMIGRSPIDPNDDGPVTPPGTDLVRVDIEGLPKSLIEDPDLLGLWDFEALADAGTGFLDRSRSDPEDAAEHAMVPHGAPRDVGMDLGAGVPSRSAFIRNGAYLSAKADQMDDKQEFSTSLWVKMPPGALAPRTGLPLGFALLSLEDLQGGSSAGVNTLCLRAQTTGASQSIIVQPFDTRTQIPKVVPGGVGWTLFDRRLDDGKWHHLTWVRYSSGSAVYLDGDLLERKVSTDSELVNRLTIPPRGSPSIVLGRSSTRTPEMALDGNIDRLRIYGRALKASEVEALYNQDFDRDGFSDIHEMETFGFDPIHGGIYFGAGDEGENTDWNDDAGFVTVTKNAVLGDGTTAPSVVGSWNFESLGGRQSGDSAGSFRFSSAMAGVGDAIADGGAQWDVEDGLLSRSLSMTRESYLSLPTAMLGTNASQFTSSFWVKMAKDEISSRASELQNSVPPQKIALMTLGMGKEELPAMILSVDYENKVVLETGFTKTPGTSPGYSKNQIGRWNATAKIDDGRWHLVAMKLTGTSSKIWIDGMSCSPVGGLGNFPGYNSLAGSQPYLWMGFRKNKLLDQTNIPASQLPYWGFNGSIDRLKFYTTSFNIDSDSHVTNLYDQDTDGDLVPDVTEANWKLGITGAGNSWVMSRNFNTAATPAIPDVREVILDPYVNNGALVAAMDYDLDGRTRGEETSNARQWFMPDSDGDWMSDGWEIQYTTAPDVFKWDQNNEAARDADQDGDGLSAYIEFLLGTDPHNPNTDGDTIGGVAVTDGQEYTAGTDPLDSGSKPASVAASGQMTASGTLPGGSQQATSSEAGTASSSYTGQDATGPRYRKISLNGRPIADEAPEEDEETDHHKEETYVDAFSLGLHHDTSLIFVPIPSSDLTLQVNLSSQEEHWDDRSSIRPDEKITTPFGPCWTSNIAAYIDESAEVGVETNSAPSPKVNYSVVDEGGSSLRFGSYDGLSIFAYPGSVSDRKSYQHELRRKSGTQMVLRKKFGTTLTYDVMPALDQQHNVNRQGPSPKYIRHRYYRLSSVEDRYGNQLRYIYPNPDKTLIPSRIVDPKRPEMKIEIELLDGDVYRVGSITDPRGYKHTFEYGTASLPPGPAIPARTSNKWLTGILDPSNKKMGYSYQSITDDPDTSISPAVNHSYINLSGITNKGNISTSFSYGFERNRFTLEQNFDGVNAKRIFGLPRIVTSVRSAVGTTVEQGADFARAPGLNWVYDANGARITTGGTQFIGTNEWSNTVTSAVGKKTTYTFRDVKSIPANTQSHGAAFSLSWLVYYLEMDIIHPDSLGTEVYKFDLGSGLSLKETVDICGNHTYYTYNDSWGGFSLFPSVLNNYALFSKWSDPSAKVDALGRMETFTYSPHFRMRSANIGVNGTRTENVVDALGRRISTLSYDAAGKKLSEQRLAYEDVRFPAFMTKQTSKAFENKSDRPWEADIIKLFEADANGRVAAEIMDMDRNGVRSSGDLVLSYTYDKNGNKTSVTDPKLNVTSMVFDPLNRLSVTHYPAADGPDRTIASKKINLYDDTGALRATIDERNYATIFLRDALGRVTKEVRDMDGTGAPVPEEATTLENKIYYKYSTGAGFANGDERAGGTVLDQGIDGTAGDGDISTTYFYNAVNSVTYKIDPRGIGTATVYDGLQRPIQVWQNLVTGDTENSFGAYDKALTVFEYSRDANTGSSVFSRDAFKPTRTIRKNAVAGLGDGTIEIVNHYDKVYRPDNETAGPLSKLTVYNDTLNQVITTEAVGTDHQMATLTQYDGLGREIEKISDYGGLNASTRTFHASTGQVYRTLSPHRTNSGVQVDTESRTDYDAAGRAVTVWQPRVDITDFTDANFGKVEFAAGASQSPFTTTVYDENGNVWKTIDPRGKQWTYAYDARNRKKTEQQPLVNGSNPTINLFYDGAGNVIRQQNPRGYWTDNAYDRTNRLVSTTANPGTGVAPFLILPANDIVTSSVYNKAGMVIKAVDGRGSITRNAYDALGRLVVTLTDPADGDPSDPNVPGYSAAASRGTGSTEIVVTRTYDDIGNLTSVTDGGGGITTFRYDELGRRTKAMWDLYRVPLVPPRLPFYEAAITETWTYDAAVLLYRTRTGPGTSQTTSYTYDGLRRNTGVTYSARPEDNRANSYDLAGNLLTVTYPNETAARQILRGGTQTYDSLGRLLSEVSAGQTHSHEYDKAGNRTKTTYQGGRLLESVYDDLNRLLTVTEKDSSAATTSRVTTYEYDAAGNVTGKLLSNNVKTITTYDALNRRLSITDRKMTSPVTDLSLFNYAENNVIGYDKTGNLLNVFEDYADATTSTALKNRRVTNVYDRCNRLLTETTVEIGGDTTVTTYTYDKRDNRTGKAKVINGGALLAANDLVFTYGANQLLSHGPRDGSATHTYTYVMGNRATHKFQNRTDTYTYDLENRLVSLDYQTPATAALRGLFKYDYDHRTRRVLRDESLLAGGQKVEVSFSGGVSVQERNVTSGGSALIRQYVRGSDYGGGIGGVLYTFDESSAALFDHYNSRGDVIGQTNAAAAVTWQAAYEAFGTRTQETTGGNPHRQKANTKDEDPTGLLNEGFRYRDLVTGSFITRDPAEMVDGPNMFTYVNQNPWTHFDPDGLMKLSKDVPSDEAIRARMAQTKHRIGELWALYHKQAAQWAKPGQKRGDLLFWAKAKGTTAVKISELSAQNDFLQSVLDTREAIGEDGFGTYQAYSEIRKVFSPFDYSLDPDLAMAFFQPEGGFIEGSGGLERAVMGESVMKLILSFSLPLPAGMGSRAGVEIAAARGARFNLAKGEAIFNPANFADEVARIRAESMVRHGLDGITDAQFAVVPRPVSLSSLEAPVTRPFADPAKLARHGAFDWKKYQPITVEQVGDRMIIQDGMTRVANARAAGITELPAYVFPSH